MRLIIIVVIVTKKNMANSMTITWIMRGFCIGNICLLILVGKVINLNSTLTTVTTLAYLQLRHKLDIGHICIES